LILWHSGEICKANFLDRVEVAKTAKEMMLRGLVLCGLCMGSLKYHGCYWRQIKDDDGVCQNGWVAQGHCASCNKYPALLPEFIMPYKHYRADVINGVIKESEAGATIEYIAGCAADVSTMRRWVRQFSERKARAIVNLLFARAELLDVFDSILKPHALTLLSRLARMLHEYHVSESDGIIGGGKIILTTQNCGFL
jgi:hypothetical protein